MLNRVAAIRAASIPEESEQGKHEPGGWVVAVGGCVQKSGGGQSQL